MFTWSSCLQVERAKRQLSTTHQQRIEIEAFFGGKDLSEVDLKTKDC
jgi:hypothetical protein